MMRCLSRVTLLATGLLLCTSALSYDDVVKAYYSPQLDEAVDAAKHTPDKTEYVGHAWYNRTTSKSFPLPKLLNTEMENLVIEGAMGPTAAGEAASVESQKPVRDTALGRNIAEDDVTDTEQGTSPKENNDAPQKKETLLRNVTYKGQNYDLRVKDARSSATITAQVRR
ncbi:hypothetical protein [Thalassolituus sp.]|jgi:hypothetical protein|uniref:hypothetical protein n=1 Tax=Thalassolituus sp. TaxID=2030822 RepID=UPI002A7F0C5D|nr:hypothetical protein [Thalassolituus sp.]|tara:strand:- start:2766 stop:3272 length:507 start_codon:yes stop_codon:yes gene_type:complete